MKYRRIVLSIVFMIVAVVGGMALSLKPMSATAVPDAQYVALGDSVAAGAGLPLAAGVEDQLCARSSEAYPLKVAALKGLIVQNVSCSGAKVDEGVYGSQKVGQTKLVPQLDRAFASGTPAVMTITIGANDVRWSQFVRDCYVWRCGSAWDEARVNAYLLDLRLELYLTLHQIWQRSDGQPPKVLFTGYYDPFQGQTCAVLPNVDATESAWLSAKAAQVNNVIRESVTILGSATYVPVDFTGHGLCSADSWVQGLQAVAPTHPTAAGQQAIARAVAAAL